MLRDITEIGVPLLVALGAMAIVFTFSWQVFSKVKDELSKTKEMIFKKLEEVTEKIMNKLEYHERHDDQRFHDIADNMNKRFNATSDDIWAIKVRNAAIDGQKAVRTID